MIILIGFSGELMFVKKKTLLIGSGIGICVGVIGAFTHFLTNKLVKIALEREVPKNIEETKRQFAASRDMSDFFAELDRAGEKLKNSQTEEVEIESYDGVNLVGHWKPSDNPKRVIIAMHGWRSSWFQDFGTAADYWYDTDCSVLYAEQRGQNKSGGDYMGFGLLERYDCLEWIKWINETVGDDLPVYLFGVSMGASTVLMTSALDLPDNIKGIVADCGFTSPHAIWKYVAENNLHLPYSLYGIAADDMFKKRIKMGTKAYSTVDAMKKCKIPVLFIHGTDDHFVPVEMTYENYKACTAPKKLFVVPGADHGMSYYTDKKGYEKILSEFWEEYD